jgi:hypothetical protein
MPRTPKNNIQAHAEGPVLLCVDDLDDQDVSSLTQVHFRDVLVLFCLTLLIVCEDLLAVEIDLALVVAAGFHLDPLQFLSGHDVADGVSDAVLGLLAQDGIEVEQVPYGRLSPPSRSRKTRARVMRSTGNKLRARPGSSPRRATRSRWTAAEFSFFAAIEEVHETVPPLVPSHLLPARQWGVPYGLGREDFG